MKEEQVEFEGFKEYQAKFEHLLNKKCRIKCAFLVFEDTYNVIISTRAGMYEVWSFSMNSSEIKKLASWTRFRH